MHVHVRQPRALRWLLAVAGLLAWQLVAAGPATAIPGQLDPGFGRDGKVTTDFAGHAGASAVVVQGGKLVAAGFAFTGSSFDSLWPATGRTAPWTRRSGPAARPPPTSPAVRTAPRRWSCRAASWWRPGPRSPGPDARGSPWPATAGRDAPLRISGVEVGVRMRA